MAEITLVYSLFLRSCFRMKDEACFFFLLEVSILHDSGREERRQEPRSLSGDLPTAGKALPPLWAVARPWASLLCLCNTLKGVWFLICTRSSHLTWTLSHPRGWPYAVLWLRAGMLQQRERSFFWFLKFGEGTVNRQSTRKMFIRSHNSCLKKIEKNLFCWR